MSSKHRHRQRWTLASIAIASGVLIGFALPIGWPALMRAHYLRQLRDDPTRFLAYHDAESEHQRTAARAFLGERAGKEHVFRLWIDELDASESNWNVHDILRRLRDQGSDVGFVALTESSVMQHRRKRNGSGGFGSMGSSPLEPRRRAILLDAIDACAGETFTHPGFTDLEFRVVRVIDGSAREPDWPGAPPDADLRTFRAERGARHLVFFRAPPES